MVLVDFDLKHDAMGMGIFFLQYYIKAIAFHMIVDYPAKTTRSFNTMLPKHYIHTRTSGFVNSSLLLVNYFKFS